MTARKKIISNLPKSIYIIFDPLDGPHIFESHKKAWNTWDKWKKEAEKGELEGELWDSFWDMSEPQEYILKE